MALAPLFVESLEKVERALRLNDVSPGAPGHDLVLNAIRGSRTIFWGELGSTKVAEIVAITFTDAPSTDDEYLRMLAYQVEIDLVRYHLASTMPMGFRQGKADFIDSRQSEGAFKQLSIDQTRRLQQLWWSDPVHGIKVRLAYLNGDHTPGRTKRVSLREIDTDDYVRLRNVTIYGTLDEIDLSALLI